MSVVEHPLSRATARRLARRAGIHRRRSDRRVPRLRVAERRPDMTPMAWFICPDWDRPAGGIRKQYRAVDVLNRAGVGAAIVHKRPGFACSWFEHDTRIVAAGDIVVCPGDVIAVPEIYGRAILDLPAGVPQVIFNQNAYVTLDSLVVGGHGAAAPYVENPELAVVTVVSEHNAELLRYAFPGAPIRRIHYGIDPTIHHPSQSERPRRVAYMTRRRGGDAAKVLALLDRRGALDGWDVVAISGKSESEVADLLRETRIFLSFSELEGFGLPPAEALACGCLVVGFDGFAGREFFREPFAIAVEDGDVAAYARAVEDLIQRVERDPAGAEAAGQTGARFAHETYSLDVERQDLVDVFGPLVGS
jgi:glycosyltransferase involved in cell wall biosynthesis